MRINLTVSEPEKLFLREDGWTFITCLSPHYNYPSGNPLGYISSAFVAVR